MGAMLTVITVTMLWFCWAEAVVEHIEATKRSEAAAKVTARSPEALTGAVVFAVR
jgi:hypothetical protein